MQTEPKEGIRVISYNTPLYYANGELFLHSVFRATGVKPEKMRKVLKRIQLQSTMHVRMVIHYITPYCLSLRFGY